MNTSAPTSANDKPALTLETEQQVESRIGSVPVPVKNFDLPKSADSTLEKPVTAEDFTVLKNIREDAAKNAVQEYTSSLKVEDRPQKFRASWSEYQSGLETKSVGTRNALVSTAILMGTGLATAGLVTSGLVAATSGFLALPVLAGGVGAYALYKAFKKRREGKKITEEYESYDK